MDKCLPSTERILLITHCAVVEWARCGHYGLTFPHLCWIVSKIEGVPPSRALVDKIAYAMSGGVRKVKLYSWHCCDVKHRVFAFLPPAYHRDHRPCTFADSSLRTALKLLIAGNPCRNYDCKWVKPDALAMTNLRRTRVEVSKHEGLRNRKSGVRKAAR